VPPSRRSSPPADPIVAANVRVVAEQEVVSAQALDLVISSRRRAPIGEAVADQHAASFPVPDEVIAGAAGAAAGVVITGSRSTAGSEVDDVVAARTARIAPLAVADNDLATRACLQHIVTCAGDVTGLERRMRVSDQAAVSLAPIQAIFPAARGRPALGVAVARHTVEPASAEDAIVATAARVPVRGEAVAGDDVISVAAEHPVVPTS